MGMRCEFAFSIRHGCGVSDGVASALEDGHEILTLLMIGKSYPSGTGNGVAPSLTQATLSVAMSKSCLGVAMLYVYPSLPHDL